MSSPSESAAEVLATIQEARHRIRALSHRHLPVAASLRIGRVGAAPPLPVLPAPPRVAALRVAVLRELRESGVLLALEGIAPPAGAPGPAPVAPAADDEQTLVAEGPLSTGPDDPGPAADDAALDEDSHLAEATVVGTAAAFGLAVALPAAEDDDEAHDTVSDGMTLAALPAEDEDDDTVHAADAEATLALHSLSIPDPGAADDEATRVERMSPALRAALDAEAGAPLSAAEDELAFAFDDFSDDEDDDEDEAATRISRIPPEVLRAVAERRAAEESASAPIFNRGPGDGGFADDDDPLFGAADPIPAGDGSDALFDDGDSLFAVDEDDGFGTDAPIEDFPEWQPQGGTEADFDVVFDEEDSDEVVPVGEALDEGTLRMEAGPEDEALPAWESEEDWDSTAFTDEDDARPEEDETAHAEPAPPLAPPAGAPTVALGAPRAVSPGIRLGGDEEATATGAAIQILGYGKARTLTPTLALGAAPDDDDLDEDMVLDGDQPQLSVAFQEPDEEPTGSHVPTLTEEAAPAAHETVLNVDGSMTGATSTTVDVDISSDETHRYLQLARAAEQSGRLREAVLHYDDLLGHDPHNMAAHLGRGRCLVDLGDYSAAMSDFTRAEDIAPESPEPVVEMGNLFFARKEWKKAISYFDHALEMDRNHTMALCRRGICHYHRKRYDAATTDLLAAKDKGAEVPGLDRYIRMASKRAKGRR